ncbi:acyl-CoA reductase [Umezawaea endophytica]|uniref:AMP-dependent synthetase/ligase domain-containing protein n=1 Tax=Umezawaea endophytica TaxID=1654476 RepID=A0A9X2VR05_9PSEU|nr:acyl-CoA reductase [Umezawaea endophytica]MCS7481130.1 hypothetical protein [Umezawaea endophytica]
MNSHYWQGEWIDEVEAGVRLDSLEACTRRVLEGPRLTPVVVLAAADRVARTLAKPDSPLRLVLAERLHERGVSADEVARTFDDLCAVLERESLERKVTRELGGVDPARLGRYDFRAPVFEAWAPVGLLAHVASGNAPAVGALSVVEGLLTGNLNVVKTSGDDSMFTAELLAALAEQDPSGQIAARVVVLRYSSANRDWLERMCAPADAVAVWGGEEALAGVAEVVRPGTRLVDWGPKLSFAYLTADAWADGEVLRGVADDVWRLDQRACSSPQVVYLDTDDHDVVFAFAERFASVLAASSTAAPGTPSDPEWAEISNTVVVADLEQHLGLTRVHVAADGSWRVLADTRSALRASPLFRTVWVKPLPRDEITETLRPMRRYLQTAGVGATRSDTAVLARTLIATGVQRVTVPGGMLGGYSGEPHDGVYALQRYSRRVDVRLDDRFRSDASLDDLVDVPVIAPPAVPVTVKEDFDLFGTDRSDVYFLSGGSSGAPKLSGFTWADYDEQMRFGAEALLATGLDPSTDRVMNLFFTGHMYGGFTSYFSSLERLGAVQFPMGAEWGRYDEIARSIVDNRVNALVSVPSFLTKLFTEAGDVLRAYGGVKKLFYAGEHLGEAQARWYRDEFGVELVRSAAYGSVDVGPMGYQCASSAPRVHHLSTGLHTVEILDTEVDRPVAAGEVGRLVFTSHTRRGQRLDRYEIGDLGRWLAGECPCGRRTPRFELLGRVGDVLRVAGATLNFRRIVAAVEEAFSYSGLLQVVLDEVDGLERLVLRVEAGPDPDELVRELLVRYPEVGVAVEHTGLLRLGVEVLPSRDFDRSATSGKVIAVADHRARTSRPGTGTRP